MTTTTNSSTSMPAWAQPYAEGYLQRAQQTADQPYQPYQGERVAGFTPWQQQGLQAMVQRAADGSPVMAGAQGALQQFWGQPQPGATANPYMGQDNPYLTQQIDRAAGDMTRNWNQVQMPAFDTAMSRSGSFGNEGIRSMAAQGASDLQRNIGEMASGMRFNDLTQQRQLAESFASRNDAMTTSGNNRVLAALGLAPAFAEADYNDIGKLISAGGAYQGQNQRELDDAYSRFTESRDYPLRQLDIMGGALGKSFGQNTTSSTDGGSGNTAANAIGGALTFAQLWKLLGG